MSRTADAPGERLIADNRKAGHDFHLLETFEAGLVLQGTEVKAIREGRANLRDSYCKLEGGEAYLLGVHIGQYSHTGSSVHDPLRPRKLLLRREELNKLLVEKKPEKVRMVLETVKDFGRLRAYTVRSVESIPVDKEWTSGSPPWEELRKR